MNYQNHRKLQRSRDFLTAAIENGGIEGSGYLPSTAQLARKAGVSKSTMWLAIKALRQEGRLCGDTGCRIALPSSRRETITNQGLDNDIDKPVRRTKTRTLQTQINKDILNGRFRHDGPLPAEKELTAYYGVSRSTLRKALLALTEQSILSRQGSRYVPKSIAGSSRRRQQRIQMFAFGWSIGFSVTWGYWHQEYFKLLEVECLKAGIALDVVCFFRDESGLHCVDGRTAQPVLVGTDTTDVIGYIYEATGTESFEIELLQILAVGGKPVAVLDEMGNWPDPEFLKRHPSVRVFRNTVTDTPALKVARYVLELGHRCAIFISPYHQFQYSMHRYSGLARAFAVPDGAQIIPVTSVNDLTEFQEQGMARANLPALMQFYSAWKRGLPDHYAGFLDNHFELLRTVLAESRTREELYALFDKAIAIPDATIWVMVNDFCAHNALNFLEQHRVAVPKKISLISFDDLPIALTKGISSYNFNYAATIIAMLRYITSPRLYPARKPVMEIEGWVIPRASTARL